MLLKKNLDTVKRSYEIAAEWAEKNHVELIVGEAAAA
jgi:pyruvate ferredoxin oxidoreductase gamma subunit